MVPSLNLKTRLEVVYLARAANALCHCLIYQPSFESQGTNLTPSFCNHNTLSLSDRFLNTKAGHLRPSAQEGLLRFQCFVNTDYFKS